MKKEPLDVPAVVSQGLCTGCGTCAGTCPRSAIQMRRVKGGFYPYVDPNKCSSDQGCDLCAQVCPGHVVPLQELSSGLFPEIPANLFLGRTEACFTGHSNTPEIRYHSASGGIASQLLLHMLQNGLIDGALVTRMSPNDPLEPESFIAETPAEVLQARSSKYCPVSPNILINNLRERPGRFAVVGLPCHIHGWRKAETLLPGLKDKISLYLGLFCSSTKSFGALEYLLRRYGIPGQEIASFAFRDEGWLGNMCIRTNSGDVRRIPFRSYYSRLRSFFIPFRCTLCVDHCAELADVSLGDIYTPDYKDDKIGTSAIIARSARGRKILEEAERAGEIFLKTIPAQEIAKSQSSMLERKKYHVPIRRWLLSLFGRPAPIYDIAPTALAPVERLKYFLAALVLYSEIFIGKRKYLWPSIAWLDAIARLMGRK